MKRFSLKTGLIAAAIGLSSFTLLKITFEKNQLLMDLLMSGLNQAHYMPLKVDDAFSEKVYDLYMKRLDYNKKFLLQSDVDELAKYKHSIDEEVMNERFDFYKLSVDMINRRITEKETWCRELLAQPFDYTVDEEYETDGEKLSYAKSQDELKNEWRKMLKYQVVARLDEMMTNQEKAQAKKDTAFTPKPFDSLEVDARRKTLKANEDWFKRLNKLSSKDRFAGYLNTITNIYDPHTEYFAPKEKKKFDQSMSGQFEGIGARLQQKDGVVKVTEVIAGSPSYKQGELKAGDEIHKVAQGLGEPVDITNMDIDDAIDLIKGKKGTEVRLTVKHQDGSMKVIPIIRDVIEIEETFAQSAVIDGKKKIGYIHLPMFYADFTKSGAHQCATDVKNEILKLKNDGVKGIIIDLRDNGGGSLQEVVEMAGLFISKGPIVQVKNKNNSVNVMPDYNPEVQWDGPLVIMVNHGSASASEILAAAMQDYKRGVIVGTPTFGKGTVQSFIDLDKYLLPQFDTLKPMGSVKVTMQKFYRINGGATQLKGVIPDIALPDPYSMLDLGEKELDYPMKWDEINKAEYTPFNTINYEKLKKESADRTRKSSAFQLVDAQSKSLKSKKDDTRYSLKLEAYRAEQKTLREDAKKFDEFKKELPGFKVNLAKSDAEAWKSDTAKVNKEDKWVKALMKDFYLQEASNIVQDMQ